MYIINSKTDKPDIDYLEYSVKEMMKRGISVNDLSELYKRFSDEKEAIADDIQKNYGIQNPNSSKQLIDFISNLDSAEVYETCCIEGKWTTNKEAFSTLSILGYQFATDILDYRKAKKYAESIKSMQEAVGKDGRVHPGVSLSKTNRINYSSPALMNIPKPLLWHIVAPNKPGNILISADIKNQEPSILINILNAEHLKNALKNDKGLYESLFAEPFKPYAKLNLLVTNGYTPGIIRNEELAKMGFVPPIYYTPTLPPVVSSYYNNEQIRVIDITNIVVSPGSTASSLKLPNKVIIETVNSNQYEVEVCWEKVTDKQLKKQGIIEITGELNGVEIKCEGIERKEFKVAWNAMTYGASSFGVKQICKHINGDIVYNYFSKIPEFKAYRSKCKKLADAGNQYINTYFGTTLFAGESNINKLRRVLMDLPIQGTAADILSFLIRHCNSEISRLGLDGKISIYYTRHDEIIFEVDKDFCNGVGIEDVKNIIKNMVTHQVDNWIPFIVEVTEVKADKLYNDVDSEDIFA